MPLPSFTVTGNLKEILGDVSGGELVESALFQAQIECQSNVPSDVLITIADGMKWTRPVTGGFDEAGNVVNEDGDPLLLLAQDDSLSIRGLQWRITITIPAQVIPPSPSGRIRSWWINAGEDGDTVDLGTTLPAVSTAVRAISLDSVGATGAALVAASNPAAAWTALGDVPVANLPDLALIQFKGNKANQAAMLATTGEQGDWITRTDTSSTWVITGADPTQLANWTQLPFPSSAPAVAAAVVRASAAPLPAYTPILPFRPSGDAPVYTFANSNTGGVLTAYNALATKTAWNSSLLTKLGYLPGVVGGSFPNVANGHKGPTDFAQNTLAPPHIAEILFDGTVFKFADQTIDTTNPPFRVWVDGEYAGEYTTESVTSSAVRIHTLTWPAERKRRLHIQLPAAWYPMSFAAGDASGYVSFAPLPRPAFRCMIIGDSWIYGYGTDNGSLDCLASVLRDITGWDVYNNGIMGSAYGVAAADGGVGTTYNSPQRIRAITEANPHLVVIFGTVNNDSTTTTNLATYAADLYAKVKAAAPNALIVVVGPQAVNGSPGTTRTDRRDIIQTAAAAAGLPFIDPLTEGWMTGTGYPGAPGAVGNASLYAFNDVPTGTSHLNDNGYAYLAQRMLTSILSLPYFAT